MGLYSISPFMGPLGMRVSNTCKLHPTLPASSASAGDSFQLQAIRFGNWPRNGSQWRPITVTDIFVASPTNNQLEELKPMLRKNQSLSARKSAADLIRTFMANVKQAQEAGKPMNLTYYPDKGILDGETMSLKGTRFPIRVRLLNDDDKPLTNDQWLALKQAMEDGLVSSSQKTNAPLQPVAILRYEPK